MADENETPSDQVKIERNELAAKCDLTVEERTFECAICLQPYNLPVEIPCGHSFCFLCIKGVCARNSRCPLCRQTVAADYFFEPKVILDSGVSTNTSCSTSQDPPRIALPSPDSADCGTTAETLTESVEVPSTSKSPSKAASASWFYEGRNGWWRYDDRTLSLLEEAYAKDPTATSVEAMISGFTYVVDFRRMIQFRKDEPSRRRLVRRDILDDSADAVQTAIKGIAGLKLRSQSEAITGKNGS